MIREQQAYWLRAVGLWFLLMVAETLQGLWRMKVLTLSGHLCLHRLDCRA